MYLFFMSVWDDARRGTKYYICHGEDTPRGFHTDTLPVLWLPDAVAVESEASRIVGELWAEGNTYYLPFEPGEGKHFFAPTRQVFELMGELKRFTAESLRNSPLPTTTTRRVALDDGNFIAAGVDLATGQMTVDFENQTLGMPFASGAGGAADRGTALHEQMIGYGGGGGGGGMVSNGGRGGAYAGSYGGNSGAPVDGEWGSLERPRSVSRRNREPRHMTEREVSMRHGEELPVRVRFADGTREASTIAHYNRMVDEGRWVGYGRV